MLVFATTVQQICFDKEGMISVFEKSESIQTESHCMITF